jgi:hypothetical protein
VTTAIGLGRAFTLCKVEVARDAVSGGLVTLGDEFVLIFVGAPERRRFRSLIASLV